MSEADEMFENIGFLKIEDNESECVYEYEDQKDVDFLKIVFYKKLTSIEMYGNMVYTTLYLEELQAIYKKSEELGWI